METINPIATSIAHCSIVQLNKIFNPSGNITVIENEKEVPFKVQRIYYLYDVPGGESRAAHAHKNLQQLIVAASGSFDITLNDGSKKKTFHLNRPYIGLHILPGIWRDIDNFSSGSICLVLASELYSAGDYIRDYNQFLALKKC